MAYDRTNTGAIFVNDRKTEDKHPDRTGSINVDGVEYFLDGWLKETKPDAQGKTKKFLSLSVKRKNKQPSDQPQQSAQRPGRQRSTQGSPARRPGLPPPPSTDPDIDAGIDENSPDLM